MSLLGAPRAVVLGYHRVKPVVDDPFWLMVDPQRFGEHLDVIRATADVVPLSDVRPPLRGARGRPRVALTFDDGYRDNLSIALPMLEAAAVPATVFVTSRVVEGGPPFWWDRLAGLLGRADAPGETRHFGVLRLEIGGHQLRLDVRTADGRDRALQVLSRRLQPRTPAEIAKFLGQIEEQVGTDSSQIESSLLDETGVARLAASGLVTIGCHTHNHPWLASLDFDEQLAEMSKSSRLLEDITGRRVSVGAYPFGGHGSFNADSERACREAGIDTAFTTVPGGVSRFTPRFRVPRRVVRDWSGDEFGRHLAAWLQGYEAT